MTDKPDKDNPLPDGNQLEHPAEQIPLTDGGPEREAEDRDFSPVISKRSDEALRHPDDILENAIAEGFEQLQRSARRGCSTTATSAKPRNRTTATRRWHQVRKPIKGTGVVAFVMLT